MICSACKRNIPNDSVFCQFCGKPLEQPSVPSAPAKPNPPKQPAALGTDAPSCNPSPATDAAATEKMTSKQALELIADWQAKNVADALKANRQSQPNHEGEADFGLVPKKPVYTPALKAVEGEEKYLDRLYTSNGEKIKYVRKGSVSLAEINGPVDIYATYLPSGQPYKTIYINMYGATPSIKAPMGFSFTKQSASLASKKKAVAAAQRRRTVQAAADNTSITTDRRFKGLWISQSSLIILLLIVVAICTLITICFAQKIKDQQDTIVRLQYEISHAEADAEKQTDALAFYEEYAACVNEGSTLYHKYGCDYFDASSFWIYNTDQAKEKGYRACPRCH